MKSVPKILIIVTTFVDLPRSMSIPCLARPSRSTHFGDVTETNCQETQKTFPDHVTGNASAARNNEAQRLRNPVPRRLKCLVENGKRDCERSRSIAQWIMGAFSIDAGSSLTTEKGVDRDAFPHSCEQRNLLNAWVDKIQ